MSNWITVNQTDINLPEEERTGCGVDVRVFVSPYDVPSAIRGGYDKTIQRFGIQFKYLTPDEDLIEKTHAKYIEFRVGKESNRLHKILIDVHSLTADHVQLTVLSVVETAIDRLANAPLRPQRRGNYIAAKRAIEQNQGLLVGASK